MTFRIEDLRGGIVISCQAAEDEPLHGAQYMTAMARAAAIGGAVGIRANGPDDVAAIFKEVNLPIIGIQKKHYPGFEVYITPTFEDARVVIEAGASMVAIDATARPRPGGITLKTLVEKIHRSPGVSVMADLSSMEDAQAAAEAGCDVFATTLSGYTTHGRPASAGPDLEFISLLAQFTSAPVIAEGRFQEPQQVAEAFARGAWAVVIGGAVTRPQDITRRFVTASPTHQAKHPPADPIED